jgi:hypothetical protein
MGKKQKKKTTAKQATVVKQPPFKFKPHQSIGSPDAETDNNLTKVFIDNGAYEALTDTESPRCIIIGRTGI